MCVLSCFRGVQLFATLWTVAPHRSPSPRLLCPQDSPSMDTGVDCHALFQGIFPVQGLNPHLPRLLHCRRNVYQWTPGKPTTRKCLPIYFSTSSGSSLRQVQVIPCPPLVPAWFAHRHSICSDEPLCLLSKLHMKEWMPCGYWEFTR